MIALQKEKIVEICARAVRIVCTALAVLMTPFVIAALFALNGQAATPLTLLDTVFAIITLSIPVVAIFSIFLVSENLKKHRAGVALAVSLLPAIPIGLFLIWAIVLQPLL